MAARVAKGGGVRLHSELAAAGVTASDCGVRPAHARGLYGGQSFTGLLQYTAGCAVAVLVLRHGQRFAMDSAVPRQRSHGSSRVAAVAAVRAELWPTRAQRECHSDRWAVPA